MLGAAELGKIIKYGKNEENLAIFTINLMATFGTKNVHSAMAKKNVAKQFLAI